MNVRFFFFFFFHGTPYVSVFGVRIFYLLVDDHVELKLFAVKRVVSDTKKNFVNTDNR